MPIGVKNTQSHIYYHNKQGEPLRSDALVSECSGGLLGKKVVAFRAILPLNIDSRVKRDMKLFCAGRKIHVFPSGIEVGSARVVK